MMKYKVKQSKKVYPISGFPGYYISKFGDVWSEKHSGKFLRSRRVNKWGHRHIKLRKNNWQYTKWIHRLILETFIGPCPEGMECCHNNGNPADNWLDNLRWDTRTNNMADRIKHGTTNRGERCGLAKLNGLQVRVIRRLLEFGKLTQKEIAHVFNVGSTTICLINTGKNWRYNERS